MVGVDQAGHDNAVARVEHFVGNGPLLVLGADACDDTVLGEQRSTCELGPGRVAAPQVTGSDQKSHARPYRANKAN